MNKEPNKTTQEAIEETEQGLGETYSSTEDLYNSWNEDGEYKFLHQYTYLVWLQYEDDNQEWWNCIPCETTNDIVEVYVKYTGWIQSVITQPVPVQFTMEQFMKMQSDN